MKSITIFCGGLLLAAMAQGQIIHVPADYPTIQQGINAATNGDTVLVSDGTYYEQINFLGKKPLMVASEFLDDGDTNHIANTIIDGSQLTNLDSASVVYFVSSEDTTSILCGFTIQHGKGTFYIAGGYTIREGGGVFISGSGAKIIHNYITENHLNDTLPGSAQIVMGAGIGCELLIDDYWVVVDHNVIDHNSCYSSGFESSGAGLLVFYNSRITYNIISDNTCTGKSNCHAAAAGFACATDPAWTNLVTAVVQHNIIKNNLSETQNNQANGAGGMFQSVTGIFSDNEVAYNTVISGNNSGGPAGLFLYRPDTGFVVSSNVFRQNASNQWTGALGLSNDVLLDNPVLVENNYFIDNVAKRGGAFITFDVPVTLQNNVFSGNHADIGGGALYLWNYFNPPTIDHLATLINNSFYDNTATNNGGAIYSILAKPLIFNSIFWNDDANNGQEIFLTSANDTVVIAFSTINLNAVQGGYAIDSSGNINEDPLFTDLELLTISENSPCVNTGTEEYICHCGNLHSCPHYDIVGTYRPHGGYVDIGAYEFDFGTGTNPHIAQKTTDWYNVFPNPFTDQAVLSYELDSKTKVEINLYNSSGELIQTLLSEQQEAGNHELQFSSGNLRAGIYFYRITTDSKQATGRMILMK